MGVIEIYSPSVSAADHPCLAGVLRCPPSRDGLQCISPHASGLPAQARMPTGRGMPLTPPSVLVKARELEKARELKEWALLDELPKCTGRGMSLTPPSLAKKLERLRTAETLEEIQGIEAAPAHRSSPAAAATAAGKRCAARHPQLPGCSLGLCVCQHLCQHRRIQYQ